MDEDNMKIYQPKLENALLNAVNISNKRKPKDENEILPVDNHLQFLITKLKCRVIFYFDV